MLFWLQHGVKPKDPATVPHRQFVVVAAIVLRRRRSRWRRATSGHIDLVLLYRRLYLSTCKGNGACGMTCAKMKSWRRLI